MAKSSVEKNKSADTAGAAPAPAKVSAKEAPKAPQRKAPGSAHLVRDLLITAVILGAGLAWYWRHTKIQVEVNHIAKKAKDMM
jgi:hypothetical protein